MFMRTFDMSLENTGRQETVCLGLAAAIHALLLFWNPTLLTNNWQPAHEFVTVDMVDQGPLGAQLPVEAPAKMSIMDTLKDMLMKPKSEEIAHPVPGPITPPAAAPIAQQPLLKEASRARPISPSFKPSAMEEDIAGAKGPDAIQPGVKTMASLPSGAPTLKTKSFGGIRAKDIPFQVGTDESINSGGGAVPIALGSKSAKGALGYSSPTLQDAGKTRVAVGGTLTGRTRGDEAGALGTGSAPAPIALSGTGGTGTAPTQLGAGTGGLQDRRGGGLVGAALLGRRGSYMGGGTGLSTEGMPSAAKELENQMNQAAKSQSGRQPSKGFDIAGPLTNRPILKKVIPQYPDWAESQGIVGSVRLYFTVTPEGKVRSNITVTKTTGYPQLDQLAVDALKQWQFQPLDSGDAGRGEWGIITFNFSLAS